MSRRLPCARMRAICGSPPLLAPFSGLGAAPEIFAFDDARTAAHFRLRPNRVLAPASAAHGPQRPAGDRLAPDRRRRSGSGAAGPPGRAAAGDRPHHRPAFFFSGSAAIHRPTEATSEDRLSHSPPTSPRSRGSAGGVARAIAPGANDPPPRLALRPRPSPTVLPLTLDSPDAVISPAITKAGRRGCAGRRR